MPKVKRGAPRTGSMPTIAISSPSTAMTRPASSDCPASPVIRHEADQHQREELRRAEAQREPRQRRRDHDQRDRGDDAADERADGRNPERGAAAALLRHLIAVETGDDRGRFARHVDQHRRDGAAVHGAIIDGAEHDERAGRIELEGERDQDGGAGRRPEPGQHADQRAQDAADQREARGSAGSAPPPGRS